MRPLIKMLRSYLIRAQTGWSLTNHAEELTTVCGAEVASRHFLYAAATPPILGGEFTLSDHCGALTA
jgi:hypothetical protein